MWLVKFDGASTCRCIRSVAFEDLISKGFVSLPRSKESYYLVCLFFLKTERSLGGI